VKWVVLWRRFMSYIVYLKSRLELIDELAKQF
jgi:hypothetical protein